MIAFHHVDKFVMQSVGTGPKLPKGHFRALLWPMIASLVVGLGVAYFSRWGAVPAAMIAGGAVLFVSLRRVADRQALVQQQLLEKYADSLPGMIYQCRLYPNFRCVITYANSALEWIYEKNLEEMQKDCRSIFDLVHPEDRDRIWQSLTESAVCLTPWKGEYRVILPRQGLRWRYAQAQVERLVDGSTLWHGFVADITWRKENEDRIRLAEASEAAALREAKDVATQAAAARAKFLAEMTHEIRTPLGSIIGFAELMSTTHLDSEQHDYLVSIEKAAARLVAVVNDTLDLSKIEAGHFHIRREVVEVRDCVEETFAMLRPQAYGKGLDYTCSISWNVPMVILSDRLRIGQVLLNLLGNAIKYTEHGYVRLMVDRSESGRVRIAVEDSGPGISAADQQKIFSPYFQALNRGRDSTGLGLSITLQLCQMMGGGLVVQSTPGQGTRFVAEIGTGQMEDRPQEITPNVNFTNGSGPRIS
jgi:signal transduction histidine kinase